MKQNNPISEPMRSMQQRQVEHIRSIDELQIGLGGPTSKVEAAMDLAREIKRVMRDNVGQYMRCSIGIGPNQLLAKIAGKLEKPNGLQWLAPENMPQRIAHLKPDDLPGISRGMMQRLQKSHIWGIEELYALDPRHARMIWRSVEGERFVRALQGENIPLRETNRSGYGQSKVLAPKYRSPEMAGRVGRWLTERAVARMRRDGYCAGKFHLYIGRFNQHAYQCSKTLTPSQDTRIFMDLFDSMSGGFTRGRAPATSIGVNLTKIIKLEDRPGELFLPLEAGRANRSEKLSTMVDQINRRYGEKVIQFGVQQEHLGFFDRG